MTEFGMSEEWFWQATKRQIYALIIGTSYNNGKQIEYDDPLECGDE